MFKQGLVVTAPAVTAPMAIRGIGCVAGLFAGGLAFVLVLGFGAGAGAAIAAGVVVFLLVAGAVQTLTFPVTIGLAAWGAARGRELYGTGRWPSYYMGVSDRRLLLLGADSWSKQPKPFEFWSWPLAVVRCTGFRDYRYQTFVTLDIAGSSRDYVVDWHFRPLAMALARLR
jgi:hypothetical protein